MQRIKKIVSFILAFCLCISFSFPAYATEEKDDMESVANVGAINERILLSKIHEKESEVYVLVYEQLKAQGAENMFEMYKLLLAPEIEREVYREYGYSVNSISSTSYNFPYGGTVGYTSSLGPQVAITYMDLGCTYKYVLTSGSTVAQTVISTVLGFVPNWGYPFSVLFAMSSRVTESAKSSIDRAGGRAYIMSVHEPATMSNSSVLVGWGSYPNAIVETGATNISKSPFPKNGHSHYNGVGY
ncbi:MAG: hypothetical protein HFI93_03025 [Lachnospiraceae bacterium]|nr:hypothetical protein [Lachnospiraceae bacterium]